MSTLFLRTVIRQFLFVSFASSFISSGLQKAIALEDNKFGAATWSEYDENSMKVTYTEVIDGSLLKIAPVIPYLDYIKNSIPITAQHFWWTPFEWSVPELSIKTQNSLDNSVLLNRARFSVEQSQIDMMSIPIFYANTVNEVAFFNDGWGDLLDAHITYGVLSANKCEGGITLTDASFSRLNGLRLGNIADNYDFPLSIRDVGPFFRDGEVCVAGLLSYKDGDGKGFRVPFRTVVLLQEPGPGAPAPPSASYDVFLKAGKSNYSIDVPISQEIPAKGTDNFHVQIFSDKSSVFTFTAAVFSVDGKKVIEQNVVLSYFRPRSISIPSTPESLYQNVSTVNISTQNFAPYISAIKLDPVEPKHIIIYATEDWLLLTQKKRSSLHLDIQSALAELKMKEGDYCYRLPGKECVRTGNFDWSTQKLSR